MIRVSNTAAGIGGALLAAGLLTLSNPKTVHAVAAALVQITNTSSNPVVTQGIGQQAAELVELVCNSPGVCNQVLPNSTIAPNSGITYTVPASQSLVVTSVDVDVSSDSQLLPCDGFSLVLFNDRLNGQREAWNVPANIGTEQFKYSSGIVFAPGTQLTSGLISEGHSCSAVLGVHGYLTTN
jgi:hypothetical protein